MLAWTALQHRHACNTQHHVYQRVHMLVPSITAVPACWVLTWLVKACMLEVFDLSNASHGDPVVVAATATKLLLRSVIPRHRNATRTQRLRQLAGRCRRRIMLTGTPLQNDLAELQNLLSFLLPTLFTNDVAGRLGDGKARSRCLPVSAVRDATTAA